MRLLKEVLLTVLIALLMYFALQMTIKSFRVFNISMLPTIQPGDQIIVSKIAYKSNTPQRGDIIVFYSTRHNEDLIKRVIAVPGDIVEIKGGNVFINHVKLNEPYIYEAPRYIVYEYVVPENNYFVLGDDRNNSDDSHNGWTVPLKAIVGKAWLMYWPLDRVQFVGSYSSYISTLKLLLTCSHSLKI
jgi:signal peptidase I